MSSISPNPPPRVRAFAIASGGFDKIWSPCLDTQRKYCQANQYDYEVIADSSSPLGLHPKWAKIEHMVELLEAQVSDVVVLFDADLFVRSTCPPIETLLGSPKSIFVALGFSGRPNSGFIVSRSDPDSLHFFKTLLARRDEPVAAADFVTAEGENGAFIRQYNENKPLFEIIDRRWNNNTDPAMDDFIRHYCGRIGKPKLTAEGVVDLDNVVSPARAAPNGPRALIRLGLRRVRKKIKGIMPK